MEQKLVSEGNRERDQAGDEGGKQVAEAPPKRARAKPLVSVRVIAERGKSALVEWRTKDDDFRRAYVPAEAVVEAQCAPDVLDAGIPYGVPWEEVVSDVRVSARDIAVALRRTGFWTAQDIEERPAKIMPVLCGLMGVTAGGLRRLAENWTKEADDASE